MVEKHIASLGFPAEPRNLYEPIIYTLEEGGKRLRPVILAICCEMFADDPRRALDVAAAVEVFHNFTLLHDDIMDNAEIRRGKSTVFKKWGHNTAILSGDVMMIYAYRLLEKCPDELLPRIFGEFNRMAVEVCEGQQLDMDFESRDDVTLPEYENMIRLKTAAIFASAAKMGAILGGASEQDCETLYRFGLQLGLAFQIQDDYLDAYGTPEVLGKAVGGDIAESKKTFLTINALSEAGDATRRALIATLKDSNLPLAHKIGRIKTMYDSMDIPAITRDIVSQHLANASIELDRLSVEAERAAGLRQLLEALEDRNK